MKEPFRLFGRRSNYVYVLFCSGCDRGNPLAPRSIFVAANKRAFKVGLMMPNCQMSVPEKGSVTTMDHRALSTRPYTSLAA